MLTSLFYARYTPPFSLYHLYHGRFLPQYISCLKGQKCLGCSSATDMLYTSKNNYFVGDADFPRIFYNLYFFKIHFVQNTVSFMTVSVLRKFGAAWF